MESWLEYASNMFPERRLSNVVPLVNVLVFCTGAGGVIGEANGVMAVESKEYKPLNDLPNDGSRLRNVSKESIPSPGLGDGRTIS